METIAKQARRAARALGETSYGTRQSIIRNWADALVSPDNISNIMDANDQVRYIYNLSMNCFLLFFVFVLGHPSGMFYAGFSVSVSVSVRVSATGSVSVSVSVRVPNPNRNAKP